MKMMKSRDGRRMGDEVLIGRKVRVVLVMTKRCV